MGEPSRAAATAERFGTLRLELESAAPTTVTVRRFYFPAWTAEGVSAITPTDRYRLVSFVVPAGSAQVHRQCCQRPPAGLNAQLRGDFFKTAAAQVVKQILAAAIGSVFETLRHDPGGL